MRYSVRLTHPQCVGPDITCDKPKFVVVANIETELLVFLFLEDPCGF